MASKAIGEKSDDKCPNGGVPGEGSGRPTGLPPGGILAIGHLLNVGTTVTIGAKSCRLTTVGGATTTTSGTTLKSTNPTVRTFGAATNSAPVTPRAATTTNGPKATKEAVPIEWNTSATGALTTSVSPVASTFVDAPKGSFDTVIHPALLGIVTGVTIVSASNSASL